MISKSSSPPSSNLNMPEEKANLARVRENQRRSRARRKDYLQELETKLRQCELQGVEASSELQLAARRVADENKRLRELLIRHGIADEDMDDYTRASSVTNDGDIQDGEAVQELEGLLVRRKCCPSEGSPTATQPHTNTQNNYGVGEEEHHRVATLRQISIPPLQYVQSPSRASSSPSSRSSTHIYDQPHPSQNHQQIQLPPNLNDGHSSGTFDYNFKPQQHAYNDFGTLHTQNTIPEHNTPITANSCIFATDLITTMAGGDPLTVRGELGCGLGMDCEVDNTLVFNVLDRYTDIGVSGV